MEKARLVQVVGLVLQVLGQGLEQQELVQGPELEQQQQGEGQGQQGQMNLQEKVRLVLRVPLQMQVKQARQV